MNVPCAGYLSTVIDAKTSVLTKIIVRGMG